MARNPAEIENERLQSFVERIEELEEQRRVIGVEIREVLATARGEGYDARAIRQVLRLRKLDEPERLELDNLIDLYRRTLGM